MIYHLVDGKIVEQWAAEDWTAILESAAGYKPPWRSTTANELV
jgi:hypothetical protein